VLTKRGRDYLKASVIVIVITSVGGPSIAAALAFALSVTAALSLIAISLRLRSFTLTADPKYRRVFKRDTTSVVLRLTSAGSAYARVASLTLLAPYGMTGEVGTLRTGSAELSLQPRYSGVFDHILVTVQVTDALGIFEQKQVVTLDLVVDSLPLALLAPAISPALLPLVQGESPTGARGFGQELYSVEPYEPGSDSKDVMWKRVARSETEALLVKAKEASVRSRVVIAVRLGADSPELRVVRRDLVTEALASIGREFIALGVVMTVVCSYGKITSSSSAASLAELADATMRIWAEEVYDARIEEVANGADVVMVGPEALAGPLPFDRPVLLIDERGEAPRGRAYVFTGAEDLTPLVEEVLGK